MSKSAWQRTGAFVGTVAATALVAKTVSPRSSTRVIEQFGKSFSSSLGAAMGNDVRAGRDNPDVAEYQRGGKSVVDVNVSSRTCGVSPYNRPSITRYAEPTPDIAIPKLFPLPRTVPPKQVPYFWSGICYRLLSVFPHVAAPYTVNWATIAERLSGVDVGEDYELVAEVIAELWDRNGI